MKILMQARRNAYQFKGGDIIQLEAYAEYLGRAGVRVEISTDLKAEVSRFDLIHLFNLRLADTYQQFINAKTKNKPTVISTIYWNIDEYLINNPNWKIKLIKIIGGQALVKSILKYRKYFSLKWRRQKKILLGAEMILVSSRKEATMIEDDFGIKLINYKVIPLGIEPSLFSNASPEEFTKKYKLKDFVLCVGRFDDLKNQLNLIKALSEENISLVLIGRANPRFLIYYKLCEKEAKKISNILILPELSQKELASAYAAAKVHVAPSWLETFSLVTLEAAACGCNIVATNRSPLVEYFGDSISYCDPDNIDSIKRATLKAYNSPRKEELKQQILNNFSWDKIAVQIYQAYNLIVNK